ncbi:OX-2 membrane glycoprotein-like isoform X2 [Coturnix japonica]|uniref:OX-2 membrane glycoprotein-like isoform X2 n=1 Tax=Coturnix japonica TaxID=93934 RepID=UPI00077782EB|nr:OX-2 membrane glycoprotein-like isoform X2 [Coturnix japonica]
MDNMLMDRTWLCAYLWSKIVAWESLKGDANFLLLAKKMLSSKMTFQALVLSLVCVVLGKAKVVTQTEQRAVKVGDSVTLSCALTEPKDVVQVTWQKDNVKSQDNIATYSKTAGLKIQKPYQDRINFTSLMLNNTSITFWSTRVNDTGCYLCLFNTFPLGSFSGRSCLGVYGLNASIHYNVSEGHLIATCSAVGLPEPTISWNSAFNYTPTQEKFKYDNGVVSITSQVKVYDFQNSSKEDLTCRVSNENEEMELPISMKKSRGIQVLGAGYCCDSITCHLGPGSHCTVLEEEDM